MTSFLIIDDNKSLRSLYEVLLKKRFKNVLVHEASNGREALAKALNLNYSAIITDINMPIMDGIEFYNKLKTEKPELATRVCFTSATLNEPQPYLLREGCPYLPKPFAINDFYSAVDDILGSEEREFYFCSGRLKKRIKRFKINEPCVLEPLASLSGNLQAELTDYSKHGVGLKYSGQQLLSGTKVEISVESMDIFDKRGEVVWTKPHDKDVQSGIHWI